MATELAKPAGATYGSIEIVPDPWLSRWLGSPCSHLKSNVRGRPTGADATAAGAALEALLRRRTFVDAKVDTGDIDFVGWLEDHGLHVVDTNVRLSRPSLAFSLSTGSARFATGDDRDSVVSIARRSFWSSRFHLDPQVPVDVANEIKAAWAGNYFAGGRGDWLVVAEHRGQVAGFLQLLKGSEQSVVIDLVAVEPGSRTHGLASQMIAFAYDRCMAGPQLVVGTQVHNAASLRLYQALGFTIEHSEYVLHGHGS